MKALSFAFEGLIGVGKSTAIRQIFPHINPSLERTWIGQGNHFSVRKAAERSLSVEEWVEKRDAFFLELENLSDFLILERCAFSDFSNLCFRKKIISPESLWRLNQWWPDRVILIKRPVEICVRQIKTRGDDFRADLTDLTEFECSINEAVSFLESYLGDKLVIVSDSDEAYEQGLQLIEERRKICSI